ncbi:MAG: IGHMBP2 family helicase [Epsilonproteobacteria bacterium]|nr:IGHMBP2 family helicase [Campylobacterota bacterium]
MKFKDLNEYKLYFKELIEKERKAQKDFHLNEIKRLSPQERQKRGRAVLGLRMKYVGEFLDFKIYRFNRNNMPEHQIKVGDIVLVSRGEPLKFNQEATVSAVGKNFIEVYSKEPIFRAKLYRLDLFVNDITFKRMEAALDGLGENEKFKDIVLGHKAPKVIECDESSEILNPSQNRALRLSIESDMFLIHGPPGTGKTTTLAEVVKKHTGKRVLVCADSNVAVDNLLEKLKEYNVVRIGHPAKIESNLMKYSIDVKVRRDKRYKEVEKLIKKIDDLKYLQEKRTKKPTPGRRRGMSDEEILTLAKENKGKRGVKAEWIKEMAEWLKIQQNINKLYDKKNELIEEIMNDILSNAQIVFATNSGAGGEFLEGREFDVVFIDEAAQAMEPSALIPLIKAKESVFFAGDHKQLPPTILSNDKRLGVSMFERLSALYKEAMHTLEIQYRMNEIINNFPSCEFYECKVKTYEKIKNITISQLNIEDERFGGDVPLVFIDTEGKFLEKQKASSPSKYNPLEAEYVYDMVKYYLQKGAKGEYIGVITPYKDHEEYIKRLMEKTEQNTAEMEKVEVKSVDGFQGREKEIIILSLVRANENEEIGFLNDLRRLNVAITRPKRKLLVIGDAKTLSVNETYKRFIEYVKTNGLYRRLDG